MGIQSHIKRVKKKENDAGLSKAWMCGLQGGQKLGQQMSASSARLRASGVGGQAIREFYLFFTLDPFKGPSLANLTEMSTVHDQE